MGTRIDLFNMDAAVELAHAMACLDGAELSPAAQALYEADGAARFQETHGRKLVEVSAEQMDQINAAWRLCAWQNGRRVKGTMWNRRFYDCVQDILGFKLPAGYTLLHRKEQEPQNA